MKLKMVKLLKSLCIGQFSLVPLLKTGQFSFCTLTLYAIGFVYLIPLKLTVNDIDVTSKLTIFFKAGKSSQG